MKLSRCYFLDSFFMGLDCRFSKGLESLSLKDFQIKIEKLLQRLKNIKFCGKMYKIMCRTIGNER